MALYQRKYRIESARWSGWDYSSDGTYFITICTKPRVNVFGQIVNKKMVLSNQGIVVEECWGSIPLHYKNVGLGVVAIMPDHFHGIIILGGTTQSNTVETGHAPSLPTAENRQNRPSLGNIIGSFKSAASNKIHASGFPDFGWQVRYNDRVIRDKPELQRIERYIRDNPKNWKPRIT